MGGEGTVTECTAGRAWGVRGAAGSVVAWGSCVWTMETVEWGKENILATSALRPSSVTLGLPKMCSANKGYRRV